uniref:hypothetical protein n=1 Tax=Blastomonas sp. CCH1-A6 TaxID=1768762 RepID=UPI000A8DF238
GGTGQAGVAIEGSGSGVIAIAGSGAGVVLVPKPASAARNVRNEREPREAGSVTVAREVAGQPGDRVASIDRTARATTTTRQRRAA